MALTPSSSRGVSLPGLTGFTLTGGKSLLTQSYPLLLATNAYAHSSGDYRFCAVPVTVGVPITGLLVNCAGSGSAVTLAKAGLYNAVTLALLASSADQHALDWNSAGWVQVPLSAPFTPAVSVVYAGMLFVGGTTPNIAGPASGSQQGDVAMPGGVIPAARQTGLADLPNPLVPASGNVAEWVGLY